MSCTSVRQRGLSSQDGVPARFSVYLLSCNGALGPGVSNGFRYRAAISYLSSCATSTLPGGDTPSLSCPCCELDGNAPHPCDTNSSFAQGARSGRFRIGMNAPCSAPGRDTCCALACPQSGQGLGIRDWGLSTAGSLPIPEVYVSVPQEDGKLRRYRHGVWS